MVKKLLLFLLVSRLAIYLVSGHILAFANQWDSPHYLYLAQNWYTNKGDESNFIVFLPLYPFLIRIFNFIFLDLKITSLFVANAFFILGGIIFYKLLRLDYSEKFSALVVILLAIFPTSLFFSATYPESLYLFLFALTFYSFRKGHLFLALVSASFLTLTRPFGIIIWPVLFVQSLEKKESISKIFKIIAFGLIPIAIYLLINFAIYQDFFAFQKILENHWAKTFALPWQGIYQSWRIAIFGRTWDSYRIYVGLAEALAATIAWLFIPLSLIKKFRIKKAYIIYYFLGVILFSSTGFILSGPRYLLSLPPFFIILAKILKPKFIKIVWIVVSCLLLSYLSLNFSKGRWSF